MARESGAKTKVSDRDLAKVAGQIMALGLAVELAPLLARDIMKAMQGEARWDAVYSTPEALREDLEILVEQLELDEGKPWQRTGAKVRVVGDASDKALAAYTPDGELDGAIVIPFSAEEAPSQGAQVV